jgi:hypothetical protein
MAEGKVLFSDKDKDGRNVRSFELSLTPMYAFLSLGVT